ncbi:MAG TPA: hypothetical protein VJT73_00510 [Polyangiaceae bacterium]|nr:hypothetical protein [Polyangiaceae bacterium]
MRFARTLLAPTAAFPLLAGCSSILGFEDGKPYASDADADGGSLAKADASADASFDASASDGASGCAKTQCGAACTDTSSDPQNCGSCSHDCTALAHVSSADGVTCAAGKCVVPPTSCATGFAHCTANGDDGCETDIASAEHCGSCTKACPATAPLCAGGECLTSCPAATPTQCGNSCVNLDNDAKHCGDCTKACPQPASGGNATCDKKSCGFSCNANWHGCPGTSDCADDKDPSRCGPTCMKCPGTSDGDPNGDAVCTNNQCDLQCKANYTKCSNNTCVNTASDPKNCGTCGHDCTALANVGTATGVTCSAGKCVVPASACSTGHAHCTANPDDGCETDITKAATCNSCVNKCPVDNPVCTPSGCKNSCPANAPTLCNGTTCSNLDNDASHCSDCAKACVQPASGGTTTCDSRKCVVHCFDGSPECAGNCPNYQTDSKNCGTCGHVCAAGTTCKSGQCCTGSQTNCGGACLDLSTDADHCGACNNASCPNVTGGTRHCVSSSCKPTCNDGNPLCNGVCCAAAPPNATMSCDIGVCTPHCTGSTLSCAGGGSQCGSWGFESNGGEGWAVDPTNVGHASNARISSTRHSSGSRAFAFDVVDGTFSTTIRVPLCGGKLTGTTNHWASALVYADGPTFVYDSSMENAGWFHWMEGANYQSAGAFKLTANTWITIGSSTNTFGSNIDSLYIDIFLEDGWSGTVYIDDIQIH